MRLNKEIDDILWKVNKILDIARSDSDQTNRERLLQIDGIALDLLPKLVSIQEYANARACEASESKYIPDAEEIKALRARTGAMIGDCKSALVVANGNVEDAVNVIRKMGLAKSCI